MKVVLLEDIKGTGEKDQILEVSAGYARNYLFPKKLALEATPNNMNAVQRAKEAEAFRGKQSRAAAEELAKKLKGGVITVTAKAGENGRLYGSVTNQEIADALKAQHGIEIDKRKIEMSEPIRAVGDSEVTVTLYTGVATKMAVKTVAKA